MRLLALAFGALLFGSTTAHAQAFKPRGGAKTAPAKTDKTAAKKKKAVKAAPASDDSEDSEDADDKPTKSAKKTAATSRTKTHGKKSRAARDGRPDDLTPAPAGKHDPDFVLITDDDEAE